MRKRLAPALLLCLILTACGVREDSRGTGLFQSASGIREDAVLLTIDGREVPAWRYLYWLAYTCDGLRDRYAEAGLELDWSAPLEGGTLADYAKDQALADTALYATVENWAEVYGCILSEGDQALLDEAWERKAAGCGGEEAYLEVLAERGLDRSYARELSETGRLYARLYELFRTEGSALYPDPADLDAYLQDQDPVRVDRILVAAGEDREAARARAEELYAQLNAAEDLAASFAALAAAGDDPAGPRTLGETSGTLEPALEEAAASLGIGQISGILESGQGWSILMRLEPDREEAAAGYFDQLLQSAAQGASLQTTESYEAISASDFAAGLERARAG